MKSLNPTEAEPDDLPGVEGERIDHSDRIFPSVRSIKFNEIEFAVPESRGPDCFRELRALMRGKHKDIRWPLEYRTVAADDITISTNYRRDTVAISAHQSNLLDQREFFADVEAVFRNHEGRPHWGKLHTHTAKELSELYPMWDTFQEVRERLDPRGLFMNDFLRRIFI